MSWEFCETTKQKARKNYLDGAWEYIDKTLGWNLLEYDKDDRETIAKIKTEKTIKKGDFYIKTKGKWEGEFSTFRVSIDANYICQKYELYPEY